MPAGPLVTVILGTYEQAAFLADAVDSALAQTHRAIEVIVIDNGSRDATSLVLSRYVSDPRVRVHRFEQNGPVGIAMNRGLRDARGEYVSFLFGDDMYLPEKTARQLGRFAELPSGYGVVYGPGYRLSAATGQRWLQRGRGPSGWVAHDLIAHFHSASLNPIAPLIRRSCLDTIRFHEDVFLEGNESLLLRLSLAFQFAYLDVPLVVMRDHPANHGKRYSDNTAYNFLLLDKLAAEPAFPPALRPLMRSIKAQALRSLGWTTLRLTLDARAARGHFLKAIRMERRQALHPRTLIGLALSLVPDAARSRLNAIASRLRRHRSGLEFREERY